jgi:hypothetical protein
VELPRFSLPKAMEVVEREAIEDIPVPDRVDVSVLGEPLSVTVTEPERAPSAPGVNATVMVQDPLAGTTPQLLVCVKSVAFVPPMVTPVTENGAVPLLETVRIPGVAVEPRFTLPNGRLAGLRWAIAVPPKPERGTFWAILDALSVTETLAVLVLMAVGEKITEITQLAPAATLEPQVLVCEKSAMLLPVMVKLVMSSGAVPVLDSVTIWGGLLKPTAVVGNVREMGKKTTAGVPPVPESGTLCAPPGAVSEKLRLALSDAPTLGINVTLTVQLAPGATIEPQPFVMGKSAAFVPVTVTLLMVRDTVPEFVRVTTNGALCEPTATLPKARLVGARVALADPPVPVSGTFCEPPAALSVKVRLALSALARLGSKVTLAVQLAPAARLDPHVLV